MTSFESLDMRGSSYHEVDLSGSTFREVDLSGARAPSAAPRSPTHDCATCTCATSSSRATSPGWWSTASRSPPTSRPGLARPASPRTAGPARHHHRRAAQCVGRHRGDVGAHDGRGAGAAGERPARAGRGRVVVPADAAPPGLRHGARGSAPACSAHDVQPDGAGRRLAAGRVVAGSTPAPRSLGRGGRGAAVGDDGARARVPRGGDAGRPRPGLHPTPRWAGPRRSRAPRCATCT